MTLRPIASEAARKHLRLSMCPDVGPIRFANLLRELGGIDAVLGASVQKLQSVSKVGPKVAQGIASLRDRVDVDAEVLLAERQSVRIVCLEDEDYPLPLRRIYDPPICLYVKGTLDRRDAIAFGIVGSRACSRYGAEQAERFGALAAGAGMTVVSGMARGVDFHAHSGALAAGGRTLAVLGCGLCHVYPPDSVELAQRIVESGAMISELPMSVAPDAKNFPPRNRIIAGLSMGVLVVEAARRSGALITARLATEYDREVFALSGRVDTPQAEGCLELVKKGEAKLITQFGDVLEELGAVGASLREAATPQLAQTLFDNGQEMSPSPVGVLQFDEAEQAVLNCLNQESMDIEQICEWSGMIPSRVAVALTGLQLKGAVRRLPSELFDTTGKK